MSFNNLDLSNDNNQLPNKPEFIAAKLDILGGAFSTVGDFLSTVAAIMAFDVLIKSDQEDQQNAKIQEEKMLAMQKQIDHLTLQLNNLTKSTSVRS